MRTPTGLPAPFAQRREENLAIGIRCEEGVTLVSTAHHACPAIASDFLIPRKMSETPGEGTGPTGPGIPVGRVPPPGESGSSNFRAFSIPKRGVTKSAP